MEKSIKTIIKNLGLLKPYDKFFNGKMVDSERNEKRITTCRLAIYPAMNGPAKEGQNQIEK